MAQDYGQQVLACYWQISDGITPLYQKYGPAVLIATLVEFVGGSLHLALESGVITEVEARQVIERVKVYAFREIGTTTTD